MILSLAACGSPGDRTVVTQMWDGPPPFERRASEQQWEIVDSLKGVQLGEVTLIAADASLIVFVDNTLQQVIGLTPDLKARWRVGRQGSGPGEFTMIRSITIDDQHRVLVADERTWISDDGNVLRSARVQVGGGLVAAGRSGKVLMLDTSHKRAPVAEIDSSGRVIRRIALPWKGYQALPDLVAGNVSLLASPGEDVFVVGFMVGDGWFGLRVSDDRSTVGRYVEHLDFPKVLESSTRRLLLTSAYALQGGFLAGGVLNVLWSGADTTAAMRYVDRYQLDSGEYVDSWRLQMPATAVAMSGSRLIAVVVAREPTLVALTSANK